MRVGKIGPPDGEILAELGKIPLCLSLSVVFQKERLKNVEVLAGRGVRGSEE